MTAAPAPASRPGGRRRAQRGFTLLELLVAAFVMAIVAMLGWRGLDGVARSRDAIEQRMRAATQLHIALQQMSADLASATDGGGNLPAVSLAGNGDLLILRRPAQALGSDLRAAPRQALPPQAGALLVARWGVRDGVLMRWASPPASLRGPLRQAMDQAAGTPVALLGGVGSMQVQVFRFAGTGLQGQSGAWVNPYTASDDAQGGGALQMQLRTPGGLRLQLQLAQPLLHGVVEREFLLENRL